MDFIGWDGFLHTIGVLNGVRMQRTPLNCMVSTPSGRPGAWKPLPSSGGSGMAGLVASMESSPAVVGAAPGQRQAKGATPSPSSPGTLAGGGYVVFFWHEAVPPQHWSFRRRQYTPSWAEVDATWLDGAGVQPLSPRTAPSGSHALAVASTASSSSNRSSPQSSGTERTRHAQPDLYLEHTGDVAGSPIVLTVPPDSFASDRTTRTVQ